jgi:hypothetical protein
LRSHYLKEGQARLQEEFKRRDREEPPIFEDSSFLFIRSYDGDQGIRPMPNVPHWRSPDVLLSPASSVGAYTTTLKAGDAYLVQVALRNRGDLAVPSAKVELYLTDPTLGFDTRFAANLTLGKVPTAWVPSGGSEKASFLWTVPPTQSGHKCLFARTFSFSPLDLPIDDYALDPRIDRHVAQQNLNIEAQAMPFQFNLIHAPQARMRIEMHAMTPTEFLGLRHPVLADVTPATDFPSRGLLRRAQVEPLRIGSADANIKQDERGMSLEFFDQEGADLDKQRALKGKVWEVAAAVSAGAERFSQHRELLKEFRQMNAQARLTTFAMKVPDLGLQPGQAVGVEITAIDENLDTPMLAGGITLVIVG